MKAFIVRHCENHNDDGKYLDTVLEEVAGIDLSSWDTVADPSYKFCSVFAERRDDLSRHLAEHGIALCVKTLGSRNVMSAAIRELTDHQWEMLAQFIEGYQLKAQCLSDLAILVPSPSSINCRLSTTISMLVE